MHAGNSRSRHRPGCYWMIIGFFYICLLIVGWKAVLSCLPPPHWLLLDDNCLFHLSNACFNLLNGWRRSRICNQRIYAPPPFSLSPVQYPERVRRHPARPDHPAAHRVPASRGREFEPRCVLGFFFPVPKQVRHRVRSERCNC
jgi:hypothetical protein